MIRYLSPWLIHILHRRCRRCFQDGWNRGYHRGAAAAEDRERWLRQGWSSEEIDNLERWMWGTPA